MMAADSIDGQMVHVLIAESLFADPESRPDLYAAIDRARFGLRGKTAFVRYSLDAGILLSTEESLALLEEAHRQADKAYTKQDLIDLYNLTARELERADRGEEALGMLKRAVQVKPEWRNEALPMLLTRLFREGHADEIEALAQLDPEFMVLPEVYDFYVLAKDDEGFGLKLVRPRLVIELASDGTFSIR
jgi:tetratricopeptide (TPR) repeat protein